MALTNAEHFAVSAHLTEWPDTMTYDELCDGIMYGHEDVIIWEKFEDELPADVIESIDNLRITLIRYVAEITADLREAIRNGDPMTIAEQLQSLEKQLGAN